MGQGVIQTFTTITSASTRGRVGSRRSNEQILKSKAHSKEEAFCWENNYLKEEKKKIH